ncbi:MAG: roadblock/LC7 domain-containing protein [Planctomycetes bacterium]|nr:roadblock/LC7 domain-containing protein [Planctomycetota bacterium]
MRDILEELNTIPGVRGSAIILTDGVVVASALSETCDGESYAALASSLLSQVGNCLPRVELKGMRRVTITATRGRFSMSDVGGAWLIVELDRDIDVGQLQLEIESAASRLRRRMRMGRAENPVAALPTGRNYTNQELNTILDNGPASGTRRGTKEPAKG